MKIIKKHLEKTNSSLAKKILSDWDNQVAKFKKITPRDYEKALNKLNRKGSTFSNLSGPPRLKRITPFFILISLSNNFN